jgi:hypothetical protein
MALMLSIMAGMLHDMLFSFGRHASLGARIYLFTSRQAAQAGMVISVDPRLGRGPMFSKLKSRVGPHDRRAAGASNELDTPAIEYQGFTASWLGLSRY